MDKGGGESECGYRKDPSKRTVRRFLFVCLPMLITLLMYILKKVLSLSWSNVFFSILPLSFLLFSSLLFFPLLFSFILFSHVSFSLFANFLHLLPSSALRYDRKDLSFRRLIDLTFVASMGPSSGGRQEVTPRFMRHFNIIL